ncbi:hypothetical protein BC827DRAFT_1268521 [Russula dissimulans]|nr:hypothetical protein BC827DRAFT_1268521 [Russula dissimulans]
MASPPPDATANVSTSTPLSNPPATSSTAPTLPSASTNPHIAVSPNSITFSREHVGDPSWPTSLVLDLKEGNWQEWSKCLILAIDKLYLCDYLTGVLPCPDARLFPAAGAIWRGNDCSLQAFMLQHVSSDEFDAVSTLSSSHATFEGLRARHKKLGLHTQVNLFRKAFDIYYEPTTPISVTTKELRALYERLRRMGRIDEDKIFSIFIINSLGRHYPHLQSIIHGMMTDPNFTTAHALTCLETEAALEDRHAELGYQPSAVALIATNKEALSAPLICSNCKRLHHTINFCVKPGDRMAGKSLDEAKAAQCVAVGKPPHPPRTTPAPAIANKESEGYDEEEKHIPVCLPGVEQ